MARIGGAFPFPFAQPAEGLSKITLAAGAAFYPPPGEWIVLPGPATAVQFFDPIEQGWRNVSAGVGGQPELIGTDGYNWRLLDVTSSIVSTAITAAGSGGTNGIGFAQTGAAISIAAPATGQAATAYAIVGGTVAAPTITQAGSGFLVAPLLVADAPPAGGIQATAVATITSGGGGITAVTIVNAGAGYLTTPNWYIIPQTQIYQGGPQGGNAAGPIPPGGLVFPSNAVPGNQNTSAVGAQLTSIALTGSGTLTGIGIIYPGAGYTAAQSPTVTVTGVGAATATATASATTVASNTSILIPRVQ